MFAVIKTGGKQYRVAADDLVEVDRIEGEAGTSVTFGEVLALGGDSPVVGTPTVAGASVAAEVVEQGRKPKVIAFKKRRRKNSRRKRGHRQQFTLVKITEILAGATASREAAAKPEARTETAVEAPVQTAAEAPEPGAAGATAAPATSPDRSEESGGEAIT
jgi:large subunit ribosomal protein L21